MKVENIRNKIALFIAPKLLSDFESKVNQKVARIISQQDPFELLSRELIGIFSKEYESPEDSLDDRGKLAMKMWGYHQKTDPAFKRMVQYIRDVTGNEMMKRGPMREKDLWYGRGIIGFCALFNKEVDRLANLYEELMVRKDEAFDTTKSVED